MHSEYLTKVDERLPQSGRIVHSPDNVSHFWGYLSSSSSSSSARRRLFEEVVVATGAGAAAVVTSRQWPHAQ
eukprot:Em1141g1a